MTLCRRARARDTTKGPQLCFREANDVEDTTPEEAEEVDDPQAGEDEENQVEQDPNSEDEREPAEPDDPAAELAEVARCLTVTARRLQGLTLGRELSGGSKTIAQRKQESHSAACGTKGHWQDSTTSTSSAAAKGKTPPSNSIPKKQENKSSKKVLTVQHDRGKFSVTFDDTHVNDNGDPQNRIYSTNFTTLW